MKKPIFLLLMAFTILSSYQVKQFETSPKKYTNELIGWTVKIPPGWEITSLKEQKRVEKIGIDLLEDFVELDPEKLSHILAFHKGRNNAFDANLEIIDSMNQVNYAERMHNFKYIMMEAYKRGGIPVDTTSYTVQIDKIPFHVFIATTVTPSGVPLTQEMYHGCINNYELGVMLAYSEEKEKKALRKALLKSKFAK
ncbi:hypothetical protein AB9P05_04465 [Roseivirga sp. BDSF3-8]|uniref:hypothetical protein n=1 Tax=Roseivirga sp. BDSF3-8 TaxID=3241598 RepID=UPI00353200B6